MGTMWVPTEWENEVQEHCKSLTLRLDKLEKMQDSTKKEQDKKEEELKAITEVMTECQRLIRTFERESRTDGMPQAELKQRKQTMVSELNSLVEVKKSLKAAMDEKAELLGGPSSAGEPNQGKVVHQEEMSNQQLMQTGRDTMKATDDSLLRSKQVVQDTIQVGADTAATLHDQTGQMERIIEDLDEIHFNMKKARQLLTDISRQLATDKCIMTFLMLVVLGVVLIVILKIALPNNKATANIVLPGMETPAPTPAPTQGRRLLINQLFDFYTFDD